MPRRGNKPTVRYVENMIETNTQTVIMPAVMSYLRGAFTIFKNEIESDYFHSTIRWKKNHIEIHLKDNIDLNQIRRIKFINANQTITVLGTIINIDNGLIEEPLSDSDISL